MSEVKLRVRDIDGGFEIKLLDPSVSAKNFSEVLERISESNEGKWVAILKSGKVVADEKLEQVYKIAGNVRLVLLFKAPRKGELHFGG